MNPIQKHPRVNRIIRRWLAAAAVSGSLLAASAAHAQQIGDVFYIYMENHNWTQPNGNVTAPGATSGNLSTIQQVYGNAAAPYINSLVTPGNPNAAQSSYASQYFNVLANPAGSVSIHPSEPNYIWQEGGTNFGVLNDNQPYGSGGTNQNTTQHLTGLLQLNGVTWKSYQEDIDLATSGGTVNHPSGTNAQSGTVAAQSLWTVPLNNFSGTSTNYTNPYNQSHQYDFGVKHDGSLFFTDTNGGNDITTANALRLQYAPLQQLATDLTNNTVARYNIITPDQFNDMHTALTGGYTSVINGQHYTGDSANIRQGDDFLAQVVPLIMASQAYQNNGAIVIWNDETESQGGGDTGTNNLSHTIMEIVLSPLAKGNAYNSTLSYTHSSDVETLQQLFGVGPDQGISYLGQTTSDTAGNRTLSDLFVPGAIPEPGSAALLGFGSLVLAAHRRRRVLA